MNYFSQLDNFFALKDTAESRPEQKRSNEDLDPTPPAKRTWAMYNFFLIWFQSSFNITDWNTGASLIKTSGLPYRQVIGAGLIASLISCAACIAAARLGTTYHLGYPTMVRATFGVHGATFFVILRGAVATIWVGVQTYYGCMVFDVTLRCVFGYRWMDIKNQLPESAEVTTRVMIAFFLFWLMQFPLMWVHPRSIRHFFTVKSVILPLATVGIFSYCYVVGHGPGNYDLGIAEASGASQTGWGWILCFNSVFGTLSPMIINQPDIARYAKRPKDAIYPQALGFIIAKVVVLVFGMIATASIYRSHGVVYWNMWDLLNGILDRNWTAGARAGIFLVAFAFAIGTAGTNIFANSIPFAADISGVFPKYFNIIRGQIFVGTLAWAIVPWRLLADATKFLTFLGSYTIFVGPLIGCILSDYFVVRKGNYHVPSLYSTRKDGIYYFFYGVNWWGCIVWACSVTLCVPGLYQAFYPDKLTPGANHLYILGWLVTFTVSFVFYYLVSLVAKPKIYPIGHEDTPTTFEYMISSNGFFEDDEPINGVGADAGTISEVPSDTEGSSGSIEKIAVIETSRKISLS